MAYWTVVAHGAVIIVNTVVKIITIHFSLDLAKECLGSVLGESHF